MYGSHINMFYLMIMYDLFFIVLEDVQVEMCKILLQDDDPSTMVSRKQILHNII
jgi:hypothetical protein